MAETDGRINALYGVIGLPTRFVVGRDGRAVAFGAGPHEWGSTPAHALLGALLAGQHVHLLVISGDHVVLAPIPGPDTLPRAVAVLERVVVTGSVAGAAQRPLTLALDVIDGRVVERRNATTLAAVLDGFAPGMWLWDQGPSRLVSQYGSIRGASSFSLKGVIATSKPRQ